MENGGVVEYPSPYDLAVTSVKADDKLGYGIIEPACDVLMMISHLNCGGMPTPSHQKTWIYVRDNRWVTCPVANRVPLPFWILPEKDVFIPKFRQSESENENQSK